VADSSYIIDSLKKAAEEYFGIKADADDIKKFQEYLLKKYSTINQELIKKVFTCGEAAGYLTVNETYFFREPAHFAFLMDLLPSFEHLRICCAAVATGCEAYSIAMLIEAYNINAEKPVSDHIDAFDINPKVIETAQQGVYSPRAMREDGSCFHFMAGPYLKKLLDNSQVLSGYKVDLNLQKNINFYIHNVMNELPSKNYDIIFFRNAFIYFSIQNRERILLNLCEALNKEGILILGVSETAAAHYDTGLEGKNTNDVYYFQKTG
jgi:chemotaxis protein methyltransferase CheR